MAQIDQTAPDLLRRFVSTPFGYVLVTPAGPTDIQCNDRVFLGAIASLLPKDATSNIRLMRLIIEDPSQEDSAEIVFLDAAPLRLALGGSQTVVVHDLEKQQLMGFLHQQCSAHVFVFQLLLPLIQRRCVALEAFDHTTELQTRDIDPIGL